MKRLLAALLTFVLTLTAVTVHPTAKAHAATQVLWSVTFGWQTNYTPSVPSNRVPTWVVGDPGSHYLTFQPDCNLVDYWAGHGAWWASNSVAGLRPCTLNFQWDDNVVMRNKPGQVGWSSGTVHTSGNTTEAMVLLTNGCLNMYHLTGGYVHPERQLAGTFGTDLTSCNVTVADF